MVTLVGAGWGGAANRRMGVTADVAMVLSARRRCNTRLAVAGAIAPAAGKKAGSTYKSQLAEPLTLDSNVTLHAGKSTCNTTHGLLLMCWSSCRYQLDEWQALY